MFRSFFNVLFGHGYLIKDMGTRGEFSINYVVYKRQFGKHYRVQGYSQFPSAIRKVNDLVDQSKRPKVVNHYFDNDGLPVK